MSADLECVKNYSTGYSFVLGFHAYSMLAFTLFLISINKKLIGNILLNLTTIELLMNNPQMHPCKQYMLEDNKHDLGMIANWVQTFGMNPCFWFLP